MATDDQEDPEVFYDSPWKLLRTMALVTWSTFRHPFTTTIIDYDTGEMRQESDEDTSNTEKPNV